VTAGLVLKLKVWRYTYAPDDVIGGAQPTGTVAYSSIDARMHGIEPDQVFLQQGLEVAHTFRLVVRPASLLIYERDEVEVIAPYNHKLLGKRFRVDGVIESNFHPSDARSYLILNVTRSDRAHASQ
jgi:hypothetical protein